MGEKKLDGFIDIIAASEFLGGMPTETITQKVGKGEIPAYKPGKRLLFDPEELRKYVKRHKK